MAENVLEIQEYFKGVFQGGTISAQTESVVYWQR